MVPSIFQSLTNSSMFLDQLCKNATELPVEKLKSFETRIDDQKRNIVKQSTSSDQLNVTQMNSTWEEIKKNLGNENLKNDYSKIKDLESKLKTIFADIRQNHRKLKEEIESKTQSKEEIESKTEGFNHLSAEDTKKFIEFTLTSENGLEKLQGTKPKTVGLWISTLEKI